MASRLSLWSFSRLYFNVSNDFKGLFDVLTEADDDDDDEELLLLLLLKLLLLLLLTNLSEFVMKWGTLLQKRTVLFRRENTMLGRCVFQQEGSGFLPPYYTGRADRLACTVGQCFIKKFIYFVDEKVWGVKSLSLFSMGARAGIIFPARGQFKT